MGLRPMVLRMKPVTYLPSETEDRHALRKAFLASGIRVHITDPSFLDEEKIWVDDEDYERALEIVSALASRRSKLAQNARPKKASMSWNERWQWLRDRDAMFWGGIVFVAIMIFGFAILPLWEAFR